MGNTANHEAAREGHVGILDILFNFINYNNRLYSFREHENLEFGSTIIWPLTNYDGNTSFHEAFINNQRPAVEYLVKESIEEAYYVNGESKSGLYLAVEAADVDCFKTILSNTPSNVIEKHISQLMSGNSLINAAIRTRSTIMLQEIRKVMPAQIHVIDEDGRTPLLYALSTGFLEELNFLLNEFEVNTAERDSNGFFPVHLASKCGHVQILQKLIQSYPEAERLVTCSDENILHVAAKYGQEDVVRFILQSPDLEFLINDKDNDGNTPLHLAAINWHPKIVSSLTWDHRTKLALVNKDQLTALEAAEECMEGLTSFRQRLTWCALISSGTPRARTGDTLIDKLVLPKKDKSLVEGQVNYSKERVNTLLLVATLVATVTFAAGFTVPGGYNNSGQATLVKKRMFQAFVMCDTIAMYSAMMVGVTLIWAQLGDLTLVISALRFALPLLGLSLTTMSVAFMAGVSVALNKLTWLANFVLVFGTMSLAIVLALFIPLCMPYSSTSRISRYIAYYPFLVLVLASGG